MTHLDYIHRLFNRYYNCEKAQEINLARAEIEELVLTRGQILGSGITNPKEICDLEYTDEEIEVMQKENDNLNIENNELKNNYTKLEKDYNQLLETISQDKNSETKLAKIKKLLNGKRGTIIDEIYEIIN